MDDIMMGPFSLPNDQEELKLSLIKAKLEELKQENQNLMLLIARITKDYEALIVRVCQAKQSTHKRSFPNDSRVNDDDDDLNQLVSLTLGRTSSSLHKQEKHNKEEKFIGTNLCQTSREGEQKWRNDHGLDLGLDCKFVRRQAEDQLLSSENLGMDKEKMIKENWNEAKHKEKKTKFEGGKEVNMVGRRKDEEEAKDAKVKKTRVSIKARCPAPMINDGCHWRKYGQKTAKGNPCPRAYYRCTISPSCPVKKQVQRSAEDKSILITTYEGTHNHSLPPAAIPMAFATSAATSHLLSGPITSSGPQGHLSSLNINPNIYTTIDNPTWSSSYSPYYLHPTITIDLTSIDTSSASHSNPNIVELGFPGHERSIPFNLNQHFMQKHENGISINDGEKITNPNHEILATALASNPRFKSVLAPAIASHIANNRNDQHFKQKDENGISISDGEKINNPNHEILAAALASNPRFESVLADAIASHIANNCSGGEP